MRQWRFCVEGELDTDITLAPFNLDLLEISSYEFSWDYGGSIVKYLSEVFPEGEVPQKSFRHFPRDTKVSMVEPTFISCSKVVYTLHVNRAEIIRHAETALRVIPADTMVDGLPRV